MKSLVQFIEESINMKTNEDVSIETLLMFLNRWDGKCIKICNLPGNVDYAKVAKELEEEFDSEDVTIEYCDDCKCIVVKSKDCENCDDCEEVKYTELFKESLSEDEFKKMFLNVIKDWDGTHCFNHLKEIANDDTKLKKVYNDVKKVEQTKHLDAHDALYSLIRHSKV